MARRGGIHESSSGIRRLRRYSRTYRTAEILFVVHRPTGDRDSEFGRSICSRDGRYIVQIVYGRLAGWCFISIETLSGRGLRVRRLCSGVGIRLALLGLRSAGRTGARARHHEALQTMNPVTVYNTLRFSVMAWYVKMFYFYFRFVHRFVARQLSEWRRIRGRICRLLHGSGGYVKGFSLDTGAGICVSAGPAIRFLATLADGSHVGIHTPVHRCMASDPAVNARSVGDLDSRKSTDRAPSPNLRFPEVPTAICAPPRRETPLDPTSGGQCGTAPNDVGNDIDLAYDGLLALKQSSGISRWSRRKKTRLAMVPG